MKNLLVTIFALIVLGGVYAFTSSQIDFTSDTTEGIQFYRGNWGEVLQQAKKENKLIFLDIYATWCSPCKKLKRKSFPDEEVGKYFNKTFINVSLNGEEGDGAKLAAQFGIRGYPSLLFIDASGKVVKETGGYYNPDELLKLGKSMKKSTL